MRPLLLVALYHDYAARDFLDSGVMTRLREDFDLCFAVTSNLTIDLKSYGPIVSTYKATGWRLRLWNIAFGLRHIALLDPLISTQSNRYEMFQRGVDPFTRQLVLFLHFIKLSWPASSALAWLLARTIQVECRPARKPDVALLSSGIKDLFWDDMVSWCRREHIPSLTTTINWDNIAHKTFLQKPDRLAVWGEQGFMFARLYQRVPAERIYCIGAPRFEPLLKSRISKQEARAKLGLPQNGRIVLFAGSGVAFDEVSLLEDFERSAAEHRIPEDIQLLYKPHPKRHPRAAEPTLKPEQYRRIRIVGKVGELTALEDYPKLLAAVDGMITPLSTMMLEASLLGLPTVGLAYDDPAHGDFSWSNNRLNTHLHGLMETSAHIRCWARSDFIPSVLKLMDLVGRPEIAERARHAAAFAVYDDDRTFGERLSETLAALARVPREAL